MPFEAPHNWCDSNCRRCALHDACEVALIVDRRRQARGQVSMKLSRRIFELEVAGVLDGARARDCLRLCAVLGDKAARVTSYAAGELIEVWASDAVPCLLLIELTLTQLQRALEPLGDARTSSALHELQQQLAPLLATIDDTSREHLAELVRTGKAPSPFLVSIDASAISGGGYVDAAAISCSTVGAATRALYPERSKRSPRTLWVGSQSWGWCQIAAAGTGRVHQLAQSRLYISVKCLVSPLLERYSVERMTSAEAKQAAGPEPRDIIGLALASAAVLALQVTATRLFSFLVWYHFAFLVLSIAFLGFTAGGMFVQSGRAAPRQMLARLGIAGGLGTLGTFLALAHLPLEPHLLATPTAGIAFIGAVLATLVPFACLGAYVCLTLATWPSHINSLYAANLIGSAAGCAAVVWMLDWLGVPAAFLASGLVAFGAGLCSLPSGPSRSRVWLAAGLSVCAWLVLVYAATDALRPWVYMKSAKAFPHLPRELIAERHTDSLSSVDIYNNPFVMAAQTPTLWGISDVCKDCPAPEIVGFAIDGWALTSAVRRSQVEGPDSVLTYLPAALPYRQHGADDTLIIGAGGGIDVLTALHYGAQHVVGVELNPTVLNAVKGRYAELAGHLYSDPRVEMHNAEGRHFLKREKRKFDLIQLSGVDTFAASQAGAFALHENYLYTVEALRDYLDALKPDGMLTFTRWLYVPERQTIRLAAMLDQVLRERGIPNPQNHLMVFSSDLFAVVMIKKAELTPAEVERTLVDVAQKKFLPIYVPFRRVNPLKDKWGENPFYQLWDVGPEKFIADYPLDIRPTTDDRPFFFEYQRWGKPLARDKVFKNQNAQVVLLETLSVCGLLCAVILTLARRRFRDIPVRLGVGAHVYFAALGLAYIFVENVLVQRMILCLGSPAYALTVILFTLLASSGLGSALAVRWRLVRERTQLCMVCVAVLLIAYSIWLRPFLDAVLGFDLAVRIAIVVAFVSPLGFLMGMPFPLAIARLSQADARLLPWAWVINGAASVLGGAITVMLAMSSGFDAVFWAAAALYLTAALAYGRLGSTREVNLATQVLPTQG